LRLTCKTLCSIGATWRPLRVSILVTFCDVYAERDYLVTVFAPEVREPVEQLGLAFFDEDLRWAVPAGEGDSTAATSWECYRQWTDRIESLSPSLHPQRWRNSHGLAST